VLWFHFSGATSTGASGAGTRHGTSLPPVGFWANQDGSSDSGAATPSGRFGTAEPPLGLWAYNSGAFDDRSSGSPTGQFGPPQPPIGFWAVVSGLGGVAVTPSPTVQVGLSGGSGRRYPVGNLDLKTWRKKGKRLKARVELVQKQIQVERDRLGLSTSEVRIEALKKRIAELQRVLLALLAQLDMSNKAYQEAVEEDEAMMAYLAYRRMH
jgi:hypothetical protein